MEKTTAATENGASVPRDLNARRAAREYSRQRLLITTCWRWQKYYTHTHLVRFFHFKSTVSFDASLHEIKNIWKKTVRIYYFYKLLWAFIYYYIHLKPQLRHVDL